MMTYTCFSFGDLLPEFHVSEYSLPYNSWKAWDPTYSELSHTHCNLYLVFVSSVSSPCLPIKNGGTRFENGSASVTSHAILLLPMQNLVAPWSLTINFKGSFYGLQSHFISFPPARLKWKISINQNLFQTKLHSFRQGCISWPNTVSVSHILIS